MRFAATALLMLCAFVPAALGQVTYCKDIGHNKIYCTGGTVIHHRGGTTVMTNPMPSQQHAPALPNPLLQNNALPTMNAPYTAAGTQESLLVPAPVVQPAKPGAPGAPVIVVPPSGSRICHQFGTTLVCN
jgi:hypothetical protein